MNPESPRSPARPRRLLFLAWNWGARGGLESVSEDLVAVFRRRGWTVDVWSANSSQPATRAGVTDVPLAPEGRWARLWYHRVRWRDLLGRRLGTQQSAYDLILAGHALLLPALPARHAAAPPIWLWAHGIELWGEPGRRLAPYLRALRRVAAVSDFTRRQVERLQSGVPVHVVPNSVDTDRFRPTDDPRRVRRQEILICGRMARHERYKGHESLLRALRLAREQGSALTLRIVGDGDDRGRLELLARSLGLQDAVQFVGRLEADALLEAYQHAGVFAMPSAVIQHLRGAWGGEGLGLVYLEAAACGRPVVASRDGGAAETVRDGETGYVIDPRNPSNIAQALRQLTGDPDRADRFGRNGRRLMEQHFSRPQFAEHVGELLRADGLAD